MTVIVPAEGRFDDVRTGLSPAWLDQAVGEMDAYTGEVLLSLPKFEFAYGSLSLKPALQAMGMTDAFVFPTADFTGMEATGELYVGDVVHKAYVGVDEHGTEAAAATAVVMLSGGIPDPPKVVDADRPFIFLVRDSSGAVLFVGQVTDPTQG